LTADFTLKESGAKLPKGYRVRVWLDDSFKVKYVDKSTIPANNHTHLEGSINVAKNQLNN